MAERSIASPEHERSDRAASTLLLVMLVAIHACNWMDRYISSILLEPMKRDLGLSDSQLGIITGLGFSIVYSITALPIARLVDRGSRRKILATVVVLWSAATMASGLARGFASLAAARFTVAAAEAGCSPTAYSLIADGIEPRRRGRAIALYSLGVPLGAWAGLTLGGIVNDLVGWRLTYIIIGAPGLLLAFLALLWLPEPARGRFDDDASRNRTFTFAEALRHVGGSRTFVLMCVSIALLAVTTSSFQGWAPAYLIREHGLTSGAVGSLTGIAAGVGGIVASLASGYLSDRLGQRDPRWFLWLPMIAAAALLPAQQLFLRGDGAWLYFGYFAAVVAGGSYIAPLFTLCQMLLPPRIRAFGSAVLLLAVNLVGMGGGIFACGLLSDMFRAQGYSNELGLALQILQFGAALSIITLMLTANRLKRDLPRDALTEA